MRGLLAPLIKLSLFLVVTIVATFVLAATITNSNYGKSMSYRAYFTDVTGVVPGDDVRIAGVRVGTVKSMKVVKVDGQRLAELRFTVQQSRRLPLLTHARIRYRNLVGQRYVEIAPPTPDEVEQAGVDPNAMMAKNAVIPKQRTENALDLTALFAGSSHCSRASTRTTSTRCRRRSSRHCKANPARSSCCSSRRPTSRTPLRTRTKSSET